MTLIERETGHFDERVEIKIEYVNHERYRRPHSILISNNGYQWSGFALRDINDVAALRDALTDYIEEREDNGN